MRIATLAEHRTRIGDALELTTVSGQLFGGDGDSSSSSSGVGFFLFDTLVDVGDLMRVVAFGRCGRRFVRQERRARLSMHCVVLW